MKTDAHTRILSGALVFAIAAMARAAPAQAPEDLWSKRTAQGLAAFRRGEYSDSERFFSKALAEAERLGPKDPHIAVSLNDLGATYQRQGKYQLAESCYRRAMEIWELSSSSGYEHAVRTLANMGSLYGDQGMYAQAEFFYRSALRDTQRALGRENAQVAFLLSNLGHIYWARGQRAASRKVSEQAMALWGKLNLPETPELATVLNILGSIDYAKHRYGRASALFQHALSIDERFPDADETNIARDLNNVATVYLYTNRLSEAEVLFRRTLTVSERSPGSGRLTAQVLYNLGELYRTDERFEDAQVSYRSAAEMWEKTFGPESQEFARKLEQIARAYRTMAMYIEARNLQNRAKEIQLRSVAQTRTR